MLLLGRTDGAVPRLLCLGATVIYLIGSLRNPAIPAIRNTLEKAVGERVFADWFAAGPDADDRWRDYEKSRGLSFADALHEPAAQNVFAFDRKFLMASRAVVLALPAGKSGHLELGWMLGRGIPGAILLDSPDRWDVMYQFADHVSDSIDKVAEWLRRC